MRFIIILILVFILSKLAGQNHYVYQYTLDMKKLALVDSMYYCSPVTVTETKDRITVSTDSLTLSLIKLTKKKNTHSGYIYLSVLKGTPDTIYYCKMYFSEGVFFWYFIPMYINKKLEFPDTAEGLIYSNQPIKKKY